MEQTLTHQQDALTKAGRALAVPVMVLPTSQISPPSVYGDILLGIHAQYRPRQHDYPNRKLHGCLINMGKEYQNSAQSPTIGTLIMIRVFRTLTSWSPSARRVRRSEGFGEYENRAFLALLPSARERVLLTLLTTATGFDTIYGVFSKTW